MDGDRRPGFVRRSKRAAKEAAGVVGVLSPFLTCEEAYLLAKFFKGLSRQVRLALGPVPVVGEDDTYPKDRRGQPIQPVKFTIRAEKCPNRRGVEEVLRALPGRGDRLRRSRAAARARAAVQALYLAAGYPPRPGGWITEPRPRRCSVPLVVCHDLLPSPVSTFRPLRPSRSGVGRKEGTFVNHAGLAQAMHWGVTPTGECRTDGQVFLDLLERRGLVHAPTLRKEMAGEIKYFAPLAGGDLGEYGIPLETTRARYQPRAQASGVRRSLRDRGW